LKSPPPEVALANAKCLDAVMHASMGGIHHLAPAIKNSSKDIPFFAAGKVVANSTSGHIKAPNVLQRLPKEPHIGTERRIHI
jgi:hypothetical protein